MDQSKIINGTVNGQDEKSSKLSNDLINKLNKIFSNQDQQPVLSTTEATSQVHLNNDLKLSKQNVSTNENTSIIKNENVLNKVCNF